MKYGFNNFYGLRGRHIDGRWFRIHSFIPVWRCCNWISIHINLGNNLFRDSCKKKLETFACLFIWRSLSITSKVHWKYHKNEKLILKNDRMNHTITKETMTQTKGRNFTCIVLKVWCKLCYSIELLSKLI